MYVMLNLNIILTKYMLPSQNRLIFKLFLVKSLYSLYPECVKKKMVPRIILLVLLCFFDNGQIF
jgi:hypothetical protein